MKYYPILEKTASGGPESIPGNFNMPAPDVYTHLYNELRSCIPEERLIRDSLRTFAYGTDASQYRLQPALVIIAENEEDIVNILRICGARAVPVTFRAAGTSLSGQAVTDSVLVMPGRGWRKYSILDSGRKIRLQPGVIGGHANAFLRPYGRKIGPDPASIDSAMIGGIAANNASGMCCGIEQNTYRTLAGMRIIFSDGTVLDTRDEASRSGFLKNKSDLAARIDALAQRVRGNDLLTRRIVQKYAMKNTTGYSLNALVDYVDPVDIIQHLMIGSEGTLGFIADITLDTVVEHPFRASALIAFADPTAACAAIPVLNKLDIAAAELMDRASIRSVADKPDMPPYLNGLHAAAACLLIETRAENPHLLRQKADAIAAALEPFQTLRPVEFTDDLSRCASYWNMRKGLFPALGYLRKSGTTVIIEDVAFPIESLGRAIADLQRLFRRHGYHEAIIFGHAREGNLHFVFNQDFTSHLEITRYRNFMDELTHMVVGMYGGALKAEHGTGRNIAPFVELEWGSEAYAIMKEIKSIFDPHNILNPGVILNDDPLVHIKNLKRMPPAHETVDACIECGYCEVHCPSKDLTLTPRQRIAVWREICRLAVDGGDPARLSALKRGYRYQGDATCAVDGLCATRCPVGIDTGNLVRHIRSEERSLIRSATAAVAARNFSAVTASVRVGLNAVNVIHSVLGSGGMMRAGGLLRKLFGRRIPQWNVYMPLGAGRIHAPRRAAAKRDAVVYIPSCIGRIMGPHRNSPDSRSQPAVMESILHRSGCDIVYPERINDLCCGLAFTSKGFIREGDMKLREMQMAIADASNHGALPVVTDASPCTLRLRESGGTAVLDLSVFMLEYVAERVSLQKTAQAVAVHIPCSSHRMGLAESIVSAAALCAEETIHTPFVDCCGFSGDRGFFYPELTASALSGLKDALPARVTEGYSTSRGCEIGMSVMSGVPYRSLLYLIDASIC
jgi:D-lactate dehydrogenase